MSEPIVGDTRRFRNKSTWTPPKNRVPALEAYLQVVEKEALRMTRSVRRKDNLTSDEREAIANLRRRDDIVIKPADKGSATVVLSREAYLAEAHRQLSDTKYFARLDMDPTQEFAHNVSDLVREMMEANHINKETRKYLTPLAPRTARFYHLPKIHKPSIPGRPIVSSCGAPTERISEFVDYHLRPLVTQTDSYLRDTTDFLLKLSTLNHLPPNCILLTLDVNSLYTNIPHDEGMESCRLFLETRPLLLPPTIYLIRMMELILKQNNFTFNNEHYLQVNGTAMGTRMAPSYASLFMANLESRLLNWTTDKPLIWWRYIDDIFAIWDRGQECLDIFLQEINTFHTTIKFTANHSADTVSFLDTRVVFQNGSIHTDLYTKPTDTHQFLLPNSCHPRHCTTSIPYSQCLRIRRICSREDLFLKRTAELKSHLLARGYEESLIDMQILRVSRIPREEVLQSNSCKKDITRVPLVATYHPALTRLAHITKKYLPTLHTSEKLKKAIPNPPIIAFRRPRNLRDLLVRTSLHTPAPPTDAGNYACKTPRCKTCHILSTTTIFKSNVTGRRHKVRAHITCKTSNLVYLISCRKCSIQYVGETENRLHIRMNGHRSDIRTGKTEKPVAAHFTLPDHSVDDLEVMGIEKIREGDTTQWRKLREKYWIFNLKTLTPSGLNLED